MYERFSDRARKVMQLANQEAQRLNHDYVRTEHLLIALVKEGSGVACNVLHNLGVSFDTVICIVRNQLRPGPNMVTMGKLPLSPRVKQVVDHANEESLSLKHNYVGTEHLLLGLCASGEAVAGKVLTELGLSCGKVREAVLELLKTKPKQPPTLAEIEEQISNLTISGSQMFKAFNDAMTEAQRTFCKRFTELHAELMKIKQIQMTVGVDTASGKDAGAEWVGKATKEWGKEQPPPLPEGPKTWRDQPPLL